MVPSLPPILDLLVHYFCVSLSSFLLRIISSSFHFIPLLLPFVKHSSNHVYGKRVSSDLGTRGLEDFRAVWIRAWTKINTIIPSVYDIVQFSWIILFSKFQRNLFQRGVSFSCVSFFYGFCSYFIKRTNFFLKKKKRKRNTKYRVRIFRLSSLWVLKGGELDFKFKSSPWRVIRIMAKMQRVKMKGNVYLAAGKYEFGSFLRGGTDCRSGFKGMERDSGRRKIERARVKRIIRNFEGGSSV